jgi:hypothetical protein
MKNKTEKKIFFSFCIVESGPPPKRSEDKKPNFQCHFYRVVKNRWFFSQMLLNWRNNIPYNFTLFQIFSSLILRIKSENNFYCVWCFFLSFLSITLTKKKQKSRVVLRSYCIKHGSTERKKKSFYDAMKCFVSHSIRSSVLLCN